MDGNETLDPSGLPIRPLPDGSDVRKVTASDLSQVVEALAEAFYDDPVFSWMFPDDSQRLGKLRRGYYLFARRVWLPRDNAYTTDRLIGGAFWMPPGTWHLSLFRQLRL